jgi:hypothetical protein
MNTDSLPPAWAPLETALRQRRPVLVAYHGRQRLVCPHALGWKANRPLLLASQTGGQTSTGTLPADPQQRWRCMYIDEIDRIDPARDTTWASATNYNPTKPFPAIDHVTIAVAPTITSPT